jgi:dolichyldiphosphatase
VRAAPPPVEAMAAELRAFSLTHVQYARGDPWGAPAALVTLAPVYVMVAYATLVVTRRDLATAALCAGQLANEAVNYALKHAIREPRPPMPAGAVPFTERGLKYGMPSDHSQFMGFLAAYLALWALRCWRAPRAQRALLVALAQAAAVAVAASRVYLGYHTPAQAAAGYGVGCVTGAVWFAAVQALARPLFPAIAGSALGRALQLRDATRVDDVLAVEYRATVAAASGGGGGGGKKGS